jgi:hypothetical protein
VESKTACVAGDAGAHIKLSLIHDIHGPWHRFEKLLMKHHISIGCLDFSFPMKTIEDPESYW